MNIEDKNIVLIVIDTLSAQNLPIHGYDRETAPFMTELAEQNTYFNYVYSNAPWTVPSHASLFSGDLPKDHGTHTHRKYFDSNSFVEELQEEYTTIAFSNNDLVSEPLGFDKGFDKFTEMTQAEMWEEKEMESLKKANEKDEKGEYSSRKEKYLDVLKMSTKNLDIKSIKGAAKYMLADKKEGGRHLNFYQDKGAHVTNKKVVERLKDEEDQFFLFINYMEPHHPFAPPIKYAENWLEKPREAILSHLEHYEEHSGDDYWWTETTEKMDKEFTALYDAEIRYIDQKIREIHNKITEEHEDTVFIITSDHGECTGEYGMHGHQCGIWEKTIRVPAIIAGPGIEDQEIDENLSINNLHKIIKGSTIEETVNEEAYAEYHGLDGLKNPENYSEQEQKWIKNKSKAAIKNREGLVENSLLNNVEIGPNTKNQNREVIINEKLQILIEKKFGSFLEDLDF
jgi:arylsulfatase A-like enzyme